ncbi:hypothetical protein OG730_43485 (plasmid) [Streptomyces sp. NBC_01298]|uniref:hypothetical protein n=1 Tax=Streptomyces sp. NBC_01298 TaxID=2903817 RepID=UPI002E0F82A9|nr:hypothetical protein OG730_43485 [Streptomyces sp. NBC_01298]
MPTIRFAPMTPGAVITARNFLHTVADGDTATAAEIAAQDPTLADVLIAVAQRIVLGSTSGPLPVDGVSPHASVILSEYVLELGRCLMDALHLWYAQAGPAAAPGIAEAIVLYCGRILTDPHEDCADVLDHVCAHLLHEAHHKSTP